MELAGSENDILAMTGHWQSQYIGEGQHRPARICRLCMTEDKCGTSLVEIFFTGSMFTSIISSVTQLVVSSSDGLPSCICKQCIDHLHLAHDFKQRCIATDLTLRKLYSKEPVCVPGILSDCRVVPTVSRESLFEPQIKLETVLSCDSRSVNSTVDESDDHMSDTARDDDGTETDAISVVASESRPQNAGSRGDKPLYQCRSCKKTFLHQKTLIEHLQTHGTEPKYKCVWCERIFSRKDVLTRHIRTHTGEQPYRCEVCNKAFTQKETLVRHTRTHSGYQPYQCSTCGKAFSQKSHLNTHMWCHTSEKSFSCTVCSKSFTLKPSLARHMHSHESAEDFRCAVCDRFFARKSALASHMRGHDGTHAYRCEVCLMTFSLRASLTRHFRSHLEHRLFECQVCGKNFTRKDTLTRHLLTH